MRAVRARFFWTRRRLRDRYEEWAWTTTEPVRRRIHTAYRGWIVARAARADVRSATAGAMRPQRTGLRRAAGAAAVLLATAGVIGAVAVSQDGSPDAPSQFAPAEPREEGDGRVESVVNATEERPRSARTRSDTDRRRPAAAASASGSASGSARGDGPARATGDDPGIRSDTPSGAPAPRPVERGLTRTSPQPGTGRETIDREPGPAPVPTPVESAPAPAPPEPAPVAPVETGNPAGGGGPPPKEEKERPVRGPKPQNGL